MSDVTEQTNIFRLTRDLKNAARALSDAEARFLVDAYYMMQRDRIRAANQTDSLARAEEPNEIMAWFADQRETLEKQVARALDAYSGASVVGKWARSIKGIGPIISAGLLAHIDISKAPTAGHIYSFAGLIPGVAWEKGQKRPWNAKLKTLCWKVGESFVKVSGYDDDVYGHVYAERKALETAANERAAFAEQAEAALKAKKFGDDTKAKAIYLTGKLPPAHIHARAKRYAVKLFLSAYQEVAYFERYGVLPPRPWIIEKGGHAHQFAVPHAHEVAGLEEAMKAAGPRVPIRV